MMYLTYVAYSRVFKNYAPRLFLLKIFFPTYMALSETKRFIFRPNLPTRFFHLIKSPDKNSYLKALMMIMIQ